jgi:glycosyltransferase involved in cell wall biosynthesis
MKVILLAPTPPPAGGVSSWTLRMLDASLKHEWKVGVVDEKLIGNRGNYGPSSRRRITVEIRRCFSIWTRLWRALKDDEVRVVHSNIPASTLGMFREFFCMSLSMIKKKKFIVHYRCTLPNAVKGKLGLLVFRFFTNTCDLAIVLNEQSKLYVEKHCKTTAVLIPNFVEQKKVIELGSKVINDRIKRALYVGGVTEDKGCLDILEVAKSFPDIEFRFVGRSEKDFLEKEKTANVVICGEKNREEVDKELQEADIFIFVSRLRFEGFSNALVEAMGSGLPCIVSDWAANRDMIEDKGGCVVPVKDVQAIISAINKLCDDKEKRSLQSQWNIKKVNECYLDTIVTNKYVDVYERIINDKN